MKCKKTITNALPDGVFNVGLDKTYKCSIDTLVLVQWSSWSDLEDAFEDEERRRVGCFC